MSDSLEKKEAVSCHDGGSEVVLSEAVEVEHSPRKFDQAHLIVTQKKFQQSKLMTFAGCL